MKKKSGETWNSQMPHRKLEIKSLIALFPGAIVGSEGVGHLCIWFVYFTTWNMLVPKQSFQVWDVLLS